MSVLSFASIALILSIIDTTFLRVEGPGCVRPNGNTLHPWIKIEAFHFLRSFCGKWPESRAIRTLADALKFDHPLTTIQMHIRFLHYSDAPDVSYQREHKFCRCSGLKIVREHHCLAASLPGEKGKQYFLLEHRISFAFHGLIDPDHPPVFTIVALHDTGCEVLRIRDCYGGGVERKPLHVEYSGRAAGLCVFQGMVWAAVEKWQRGWLDVLDLLDNELSVSVSVSLLTSIMTSTHALAEAPPFLGRVMVPILCGSVTWKTLTGNNQLGGRRA